MKSSITVSIPDSARGPARARDAVARLVGPGTGSPDDDAVATALLLVSEVVTNAIVHGAPPIVLRCSCVEGVLRVEVEDRGQDLPVVKTPGLMSECGRGVLLVERFSSRWGVDRHKHHKTTWFECSV